MRVKRIAGLLMLSALWVITGEGHLADGKTLAGRWMIATEPQTSSFTLTHLPENGHYSLVISDGDEGSNSGSFSVDQLQILRAVMLEAEKFALSEEGVSKEPITTRFMDKGERAFIIDVQKVGNQSLLFLTLKTEIGRVTVNAGKINRSIRRKEGFFFDLLAELQSVLPKPLAQPSK
ncbi:MAG TPA: hypothetical protein VNS63_02120 [Blastocatellia bacterium]|nr:hypothetical protein [Blastocatellia bacterium]